MLFRSEVSERDKEEAQHGRYHTHRYVGHTSFIWFSNVFEVEVAIIAEHERSESNKQFRQRGMDVHIVLCFDVFGSEFTEMDFVESIGRLEGYLFKGR